MIYLFIFIIGLFFGSFLNVLADRLPKGKTVVKGRSYCDFCKKTLSWYDLIPVLSFVILGGKCRYCHKKLSLYYPVTEVVTGLMFLLTYLFVIHNPEFLIRNESFYLLSFIFYLIMVSSFIVIFFTDLKYGIIPDKILFFAIIINFLYLLLINHKLLLINHILTAFGTVVFFILITLIFYVFTKKIGFGGGDLKLSFFLGLFLGFPAIVASLYLAFLTGAFISIILVVWGKKNFSRDSISFGPFLVLGTIISLFFGGYILTIFSNLLGI